MHGWPDGWLCGWCLVVRRSGHAVGAGALCPTATLPHALMLRKHHAAEAECASASDSHPVARGKAVAMPQIGWLRVSIASFVLLVLVHK